MIHPTSGTGEIYIPHKEAYQISKPSSSPAGIVFFEDSFLTVKEVFRYDYPDDTATAAQIVRLEYSYHYHIPHRKFFLRYDFHPKIGDPKTHPKYHLHVGCWHEEVEDKLPTLPRLPSQPLAFKEILEIIRVNFLESG